jgi:hypothetical protein
MRTCPSPFSLHEVFHFHDSRAMVLQLICFVTGHFHHMRSHTNLRRGHSHRSPGGRTGHVPRCGDRQKRRYVIETLHSKWIIDVGPDPDMPFRRCQCDRHRQRTRQTGPNPCLKYMTRKFQTSKFVACLTGPNALEGAFGRDFPKLYKRPNWLASEKSWIQEAGAESEGPSVTAIGSTSSCNPRTLRTTTDSPAATVTCEVASQSSPWTKTLPCGAS